MASRLGLSGSRLICRQSNIAQLFLSTPFKTLPSTIRPAGRSLSHCSQPTFTTSRLCKAFQITRRSPILLQTRRLSTETKAWVLSETRLAVIWTARLWIFIGLGSMIWFGFQVEAAEKENPTPSEWSFWTRQAMRQARAIYDVRKFDIAAAVDYAGAGLGYADVLKRLEDRKGDGVDLEDGGDIYVPGIGTAGVDYSSKSWAWRACYVEAVMSLGKCAEHCEKLVLDKTRGIVFSQEMVIGPSNPDPRPVPTGTAAAPLEENCTRPVDAPETYYMRILTGTGFTTKHKLDAALAYASWLEHQDLHESAEEMYKWGVDIALRALPDDVDKSSIIDEQSVVLKAAPGATTNLLVASTALATHRAMVGNTSEALPILLSVLRARRTAPVSFSRPPQPTLEDYPAPPDPGFFWNLFREPRFTPPPPTGDTPITRSVEQATCDDAELMIYIGEILFASAAGKTQKANQDQGLSWTRQAVTIAETNLASDKPTPGSTIQSRADERKKCQQCLKTAAGNWELMLERLLAQTPATPEKKKGWFSGSSKPAEHTEESILADIERVALLKDRVGRQRSLQ